MSPLFSIVVFDGVQKLLLNLIVFSTGYYPRVPAFGSVGQSAVSVHFVLNIKHRHRLGRRCTNSVGIIHIIVRDRRQRAAVGGTVTFQTFAWVKQRTVTIGSVTVVTGQLRTRRRRAEVLIQIVNTI